MSAETAAAPQYPASLPGVGEITAGMLRETFPQWRIIGHPGGGLTAVRGGPVRRDGPESLLRRVIPAANPVALAERLCLQEHLDGLDAAALEAAWRNMRVGS